MKSARSALPIALFLVMIPALAQGQPAMPVPVDPALTDAATLRYQYAVGTADTYRMEMRQQMTMSGLGMGNAETSMVMSMDTTQAVQSVDEGGNGTILQTLGNTTVELLVNGQPVPAGDLGGMVNGLTMTIQVTPRGEMLDSQLGEVSDPQLAQMVGMLEDSFTQMTLELPEEEVAIGHTWSQDLPFDMDQPGMDLDTSTTATYTFVGWAQVDGASLAVLQSNVQIALSGTFAEMGMTTTASGTGAGQGYTYFDNATGKIHSGIMEMTLNMTISGEGMNLDQAMTMTVNITKI